MENAGRIAEVEHPKVERVRHVGRRSCEQVEHGRHFDPLEVVHASSSLSKPPELARRQGLAGGTCPCANQVEINADAIGLA